MTPEKELERAIVRAFVTLGYSVDEFSQRRAGKCSHCGKTVYAGTQQTLGLPDLRIKRGGVRVWLEVKAGTNKLSAYQSDWMYLEILAGGRAAPVWSVGDALYVAWQAGDRRLGPPATEVGIHAETLDWVTHWLGAQVGDADLPTEERGSAEQEND